MRIAWALFFISLTAGCGGAAFPCVPVSGTVTLNGTPLADAQVIFEPQATSKKSKVGLGSTARTDAAGRFTLTCVDGQRGAVPGPHRVKVLTLRTKSDPTNPDRLVVIAPERVAASFNDKSTLTFDVPPDGTDKADLTVTSK